MSSYHRRIQQSMLKYLRSSHLALLMLGCALSGAAAAEGATCLYSKQRESRPPNVISSVRDENSVSYMLRGGMYANVVTWECSRLGKRVLIEIPTASDGKRAVETIIKSVAGDKVYSAFSAALNESASKYGVMKFSRNVEGFDIATIEVQRDEYGSRYVLIYYTSD